MSMDKPKFVSLFAGAGLMDLGFEQAGWECVKAVEWDKHAVATWRHNRPGHEDRILCEDIRKVTPEMLGVEHGTLDLIIGGPPCPGFSVANNARVHKNGNISRWKDDPRNLLYKEYLRLVTALQPRMLVMENVKPMFSTGATETGKPGPIMREILNDFAEIGYRATAVVLDAADYGVPQFRERTIVIGVRADLPAPIVYPVQTHGAAGSGFLPWITVRQAIGDLPDPSKEFDLPPDRYQKQVELRVGAGNHPRDFSVQFDEPGPTIGAQAGSGGFSQPIVLRNHQGTTYKVKDNGYLGNRPLDPDMPSPALAISANGGGAVPHPHPGPLNHEPSALKFDKVSESDRSTDWNRPAMAIITGSGTGGPIPQKHPGPLNHEPTYNDGKTTLEVLAEHNADDRPAGTLAADPRLSRPGNHHNLKESQTIPRRLTPRECARLQSVPDWYFFCGSKSATYRQIGNGVPVELARRIAAVLIGTEKGREVKPYQPQLTFF